jgi:RNA polymerase sigma-70 factor, ECF subfamily
MVLSPEVARRRFGTLLSAYGQRLYRYARHLSRNDTEAEDLVQETFMRAWRAIGDLRDEKATGAWLVTILRREFARRYRKKLSEDADNIDDWTDLGEAPRVSADTMALRQALNRLPLSFSEPLLLQVLWGYSLEEIALELALPAKTVATRLFRARQRLRTALGREPLLTVIAEQKR